MNKKKDSKEIVSEVVNTLSQVFIASLGAMASGSEPYTTGAFTLLSEFTQLRGRLKVNRTLNFVSEFGKYIETIDKEFDWKNVNREDFGDFFEELLTAITKTNSKNKLDRFKRLLFSQIKKPADPDMASRYLALTTILDDGHILILNHFFVLERKLHSDRASLDKLQTHAIICRLGAIQN